MNQGPSRILTTSKPVTKRSQTFRREQDGSTTEIFETTTVKESREITRDSNFKNHNSSFQKVTRTSGPHHRTNINSSHVESRNLTPIKRTVVTSMGGNRPVLRHISRSPLPSNSRNRVVSVSSITNNTPTLSMKNSFQSPNRTHLF